MKIECMILYIILLLLYFQIQKEIIYDSVKGFIYGKAQSVENLENMVEYNTKFIRFGKTRSNKTVNELKNIIKQILKHIFTIT